MFYNVYMNTLLNYKMELQRLIFLGIRKKKLKYFVKTKPTFAQIKTLYVKKIVYFNLE